ncbi:ribosomal-protein-alanine N-acetyltransferase [Bathymodiolus thermophilus thioautotrophic gill symbiont]|uniref:[Ribosomal protein bS18]-alanine N-acetyltransferase n=1 Tax=Bathymodiolus thermophilus thioautotrophic gill symbiont TaxID=2360 RepID=A0A1J5U9J3_9GAMM|nr:ribosomal-protein-alanine N-acetyltransferase [Bathymodiolus thermophilus thioautotrophic gill symbiont]
MSFRVFDPQYIDAVLAIERLAYKTPWSEVQFIQSLSNSNILAHLILQDNQIVGYSIALHTLEFTDLLNICIHPTYQHQGLGAQLFNHLLDTSDIKEVFIEVRITNYNALLFYKKLGFKVINIRKKYYSDGEDAKILRFLISN